MEMKILKARRKKRLDVCLELIGKRGKADIFSKWQMEMRDHQTYAYAGP